MNRLKPKTSTISRVDPRDAVRRDSARLQRREKGHRSFWRSLAVVGMVGWPIALGAVGGSFLGNYFDKRYGNGVHFTLMLLTAGVLLGCLAAWKTIVQKHD